MPSTHADHTAPLRVVAYLRVSTDDQHLGPEAQLADIRAWCDREGAELGCVHTDHGVSGGAPLDKRPALLAAVDALGSGDVLLVAKRDRLARDVMVAAMVERLAARKGATVRAANGAGDGDGPEAQLMRRMVDAFAEYEREIIRARTRAALAVKASRGERVGDIPLGSQLAADGVHLERNDDEAEAVERILTLRAEGVSIRGIAERLNGEGVAARGARWHATSVARVLKRAA